MVSGAAKKTTATARGENDDVILNVTIYLDSAAVKEALGDDLGGHYIVAQVKVEPKYTKEITIDRDDFILRTDKDGDRTKPMAPEPDRRPWGAGADRHAGPGRSRAPNGAGAGAWGAIGMGGGGVGAGGGAGHHRREGHDGEQRRKENPLKKMLDAKVLPEKKIEEPVTGFCSSRWRTRR